MRAFARFLAVGLVALGVLLAVPARSASATPPEVETFSVEDSIKIGPCPSGVTLEETFTVEERVTTFFDRAGIPVRIQIHSKFLGVITNPATGQSVKDRGHNTITDDLVDGTVTNVGLVFSTTVPGVGVVFHDVGRVVFDADGNVSFEGGPHDTLHGDVVALLCAAIGA